MPEVYARRVSTCPPDDCRTERSGAPNGIGDLADAPLVLAGRPVPARVEIPSDFSRRGREWGVWLAELGGAAVRLTWGKRGPDRHFATTQRHLGGKVTSVAALCHSA
jgi:hypothetical protein